MKRLTLLFALALLASATFAQVKRAPAPERTGWEEDWGLYGDVVGVLVSHHEYYDYYGEYERCDAHKKDVYKFITPEGDVHSHHYYDKNNHLERGTYYSYDHEGRNTRVVQYNDGTPGESTLHRFTEKGEIGVKMDYDRYGLATQTTFLEYDPAGNLVEEAVYNRKGDLDNITFYQYNDVGDCTLLEFYNSSDLENPSIVIRSTYEYDSAWNITKHLVSGNSLRIYCIDTYDKQGRLVESAIYDSLTDKLTEKQVNTYDARGNITETTCYEPRFDGRMLVPVSTTTYLIGYEDDSALYDSTLAILEGKKPSEKVVKKEVVSEEQVFVKVEKMPSFMGGDLNAFRAWFGGEFKYPAIAAENGIQGRLVVQFVIEKDGRLTNIQFLQSPDPVFNEEVVRVLKKSPKWTPGYQQNKPVRVSYVLPIDIRLQ